MKKIAVLFMILTLTSIGCESVGSGTKKGAAIGGLVGAAAGGIIGHQDGHGWEGALIGGAAGVLAGGLIGHQFDKEQKANNPDHLSIEQIAQMGVDGVPDDVIINEIKRTGSQYKLTSELISYLKENNVGDTVIDHMLTTT